MQTTRKPHPRKKLILDVWKKEPETMDELARCAIAVINSQRDSDGNPIKVAGLAWELTHGDVSNSHHAPLDGVTNWGGRPGTVKTYPGWSGRLWIRYSTNIKMFGSSPIEAALLHTGTGGFGSYSGPWEKICKQMFKMYGYKYRPKNMEEPQVYSWDMRVFDSDFPLLRDAVEKELIWHALKGTRWTGTHQFSWNDPATVKKDEEFFLAYATYQADLANQI